jgi:hypothetical protein
MKNRLKECSARAAAVVAAVLALAAGAGAQAPDSAARPDSAVRRGMPTLEIPEITIVGKKAITLPFARKGEMYDVPVYEAPGPDSALLTERPPIDLPSGSLPRYEQRENPWRISAEGLAGSYSTFGLIGYVDYHTQRWNLSTVGGYRRTDGHVDNSAGDEYRLGGRYTSLVTTDNDVLRDFRLNGDIEFRHDAFGMPGLAAAGVERGRDLYAFGAGVSSVKRDGIVYDFTVAADVLSVDDAAVASDSGITATSPSVDLSVAGDLGDFRLITGFSYTGSSLDYQHGVSSPSLASLLAALQWRIAAGMSFRAGAEYAGGTGTDDVSRSRLSPLAELDWDIGAGRRVNLWFRSGMKLTAYTQVANDIPYLAREVDMVPETRTLDLGGSVWYNSGMLTLQLTGGYARADNRLLVLADSGRIFTGFGGTWESKVGVEGTIRPQTGFRVRFNSTLRPSQERDADSQLPMTPLFDAGAQAEYDLAEKWTLNAALRGWTDQNVDRAGSSSIAGAVVVDAGASTTIVPQLLLSAGVRNLLDQRYEWWSGYPARGIDVYLTAKARF